jgi:type IV pilus assembly PilX-like protein
VRRSREEGIALITVMLILAVVSAMVVGLSWMVMTDQRLGGNNQDREASFYGAEAGMEKLTADLGNVFATKGAVTGADLTSVPITAPPVIPGIQYLDAAGVSTYQVTCNGCPGAPTSQNGTILPPSPYSGMSALITPFTLTVAAQTTTGAEVKLQRQIQLVAIPVFQFGVFSQTDLSFFNGPPFDFGGRVHTNGNLWLAANAGPLYLADKVTASGQVILSNLENGYPGGGGTIVAGGTYGGTVDIATTPLPIPPNPARPPYVPAQWQAVGPTQGSVQGPNVYGGINTANPNPNWSTEPPVVNGMLKNGTPQLNLTSSALGGLTQPIFLIERPVQGELAANPGQFNERYFAGGGSQAGNGQVSLRILLDDYPAASGGPLSPNACSASDMTLLDTVTPTIPVDLATLAFNGAPGPSAAWYTGVYPLPLSDGPLAGNNYNTYTSAGALDGYWQAQNSPVITGCIKIEYENAAGVFTDVTKEVLNLGITGRNINPQAVGAGAINQLLFLPNTGTIINPSLGICGGVDPSNNAVIRIARLRDNPSSLYNAPNNSCAATLSGYDYWPMVLYDTREAVSRDNPLPNNGSDAAANHPEITAEGVMDYIELDVSNLQKWFTGAIGASGVNASNVGGYAVYFSDRRGNQIDPVTALKTASFGFNDIINGPTDPANGCPNGALDPGEDFVGDLPATLRTYGGNPLVPADQPGNPNLAIQGLLPNLLPNLALVLLPNPNCGAAANPPSPIYIYQHNQEAREDPPVFFRHALKLVNGGTINLGTACYGVAPNPPCGLTIVAENPIYIQGEYNDGGVNNGTWTGSSVAASVAGDSVTFLSDNWNDVNSFISPYDPNSRPGVTTSYRTAIISGKGIPFVQPNGTAQDYGTDGGVHNFLRYVENWGGTLYYEGSLVSFYYSAQAIGPYKCCTTVYSPPNRSYFFDQNFTAGPQWLPPRTPTLRSINTVGFSQDILPTQ